MQALTPKTGLVLLFTTLLFAHCKHKGLPDGDPGNGGLTLADGFAAVVVADSLGRARHMAVNNNGDIYVKLRNVDAQGGSVALRDTDNDGKADIIQKFGGYPDSGAYGTAMRIHKGYLYFSTSGEVYRQKLTPGKLVPESPIETIVVDDYLNDPHGFEHIAKPIAFDNRGHLYVPFGSPGDACQELKRVPGSRGIMPCPELGEHGGVWQFDEAKPNQTIKGAKRYATGLRSIVAMNWNTQNNDLYALQHGRDNLVGTWPQLFNAWQSAVLPSEEFFRVKEGIDGGWPYYYYDWIDKKKKLNPEYGGDGRITARGKEYEQPIMGFPGHWAPNDLLFYTGNQFPERYRNGAFIAFHGSTIRAPYPQGGYFVAFVPFSNGRPSGDWEVFADGFAGVDTIYNTSDAKARPMGLAQGPDGSLYITESVKGKVWRILFKGDRNRFDTQNLAAMTALKTTRPNIKHPDVVTDNLQQGMLAGGGHVYTTYCAACHQYNGQGDGSRFPPVANSDWVNGNKQRLIQVLLKGLNQPIQVNGVAYNNVMPAHNFLKDAEISAVLSYVRRTFNNNLDSITPAEVTQVRSGILLASRKKP